MASRGCPYWLNCLACGGRVNEEATIRSSRGSARNLERVFML